jgi:hypothetical protein
MADDHRQPRGPQEMKELGRRIVRDHLESLGCSVTEDPDRRSSRLTVRSRTTTSTLYLSTQHAGGYAFWAKRRLQPQADRFVALVCLHDDAAPSRFLIPTLDWLDASGPLTDPDYLGRKSEPEYGVRLTDLAALRRYVWTAAQDAALAR